MGNLSNESINIDTQRLSDDITAMLGKITAMEECMNQIKLISQNINHNWKSLCGDKIHQHQSTIITDMEETFSSYGALVSFLENTIEKYSLTEQAIKKSDSAFSDY